jgi:hypothetical protein
MKILLRPGIVDDEQPLLGLFDESVLWLTERGLSGQWGSQRWSERPETKERVASSASSSGLTVAEVADELIGALEVSEDSPPCAPVTNEPGLYVLLLLTSSPNRADHTDLLAWILGRATAPELLGRGTSRLRPSRFAPHEPHGWSGFPDLEFFDHIEPVSAVEGQVPWTR